jgi:hypothetical protein
VSVSCQINDFKQLRIILEIQKGKIMILQIYHCNLVLIQDKRGAGSSKGKSKQVESMKPYISKLGENDFSFYPSTEDFISVSHAMSSNRKITSIESEDDMGRLIEKFRNIDLASEDFINIDWEKLAVNLNISLDRVLKLRDRAYSRGLLRNLTIEYDLQKWLHHSRNKGVIVVMTCIEACDYDNPEIGSSFVEELTFLRDNMINTNHGDFLNIVIIVPNVHLAEESNLGCDHEKNLDILTECRDNLQEVGYCASINSYGRAKTLILGIVGHQAGGFIRRTIRPKDHPNFHYPIKMRNG